MGQYLSNLVRICQIWASRAKRFHAKKGQKSRQDQSRILGNRGIVARQKTIKKHGEFTTKYNVIAVLTKIQKSNTDKESN